MASLENVRPKSVRQTSSVIVSDSTDEESSPSTRFIIGGDSPVILRTNTRRGPFTIQPSLTRISTCNSCLSQGNLRQDTLR